MKTNLQKLIAMGLCLNLAVMTLVGCKEEQAGKGIHDVGSATGSAVTEGSSRTGSALKGNSAVSESSSQEDPAGIKKKYPTKKKTFHNLDGMDIKIGDWYTDGESLAERTDTFGKKQNKYWKSIQDQYHFTITRNAFYSYSDATQDYVNGVMANNPKCDLYYLYPEFVSEPLLKGLMYDLSTLPEFDFSEEKWNPTVCELMSIGDGIWGMSPDNEPRGGIFYNKRMFKEAGIDVDEPYELQKSNQWTWDKFEEYCKKLTKDTNGDGKTDQYAMAAFSKQFLPLCAANNNAAFVTRERNGRYINEIATNDFADSINWGIDLIKKGFIKSKPKEGTWDWYLSAFYNSEVAMITAEVYQMSIYADMEDEWGFVMFPYNKENKEAVNKTIPNDNIVVMPGCFKKEEAEKIAFAYDLYTEPVAGYTPKDQIRNQYYPQLSDKRAAEETIPMMLDEKHKQTSYLSMISEIDDGDFCYPVYERKITPAKKIEELSTKWDKKIEKANANYKKVNANYEKFAREHMK